ncbi:fimbrial protein [Cronobacter dublinensis]|uniref:fimbrial protein n=1 Tax=Cronobacter dublinensis TaxID=413497 RepID=UPI00377014E4
MKKFVLTAVLAGAACWATSSFAAANGEGQVNFSGEIIDSACEVVNTASSPLQVSMGKIAKSVFSSVGATSTPTLFKIQLKNCPETVTSASITFGGTPDTNNNNVLALKSETGVASGVGVQILDSSESPLNLLTPSSDYSLESGDVTNDLQFGARYIATSATVTAGKANAVSTFTVVYN